MTRVGLNRTNGQAEAHVERPHPFHVALSQIIVHRDDVNRTGDGIQKCRQRRHQRLAFARDHLGNHPLVQDVSADHLHIVMTHLEISLTRFTHGREGIRDKII